MKHITILAFLLLPFLAKGAKAATPMTAGDTVLDEKHEYYNGKCTHCNDSIPEGVTPQWNDWALVEAPTCHSYGTWMRTASDEDATYTETKIAFKKYHKLSDGVCTVNGCTYCEPEEYSGDSTQPPVITEENYAQYGLTALNYRLFLGHYAISNGDEFNYYLQQLCAKPAFLVEDIDLNYAEMPYYDNPILDGTGHVIKHLFFKEDPWHGFVDNMRDFSVLRNIGFIKPKMQSDRFANTQAFLVAWWDGGVIENCFIYKGEGNVPMITWNSGTQVLRNCYVISSAGVLSNGSIPSSNCFAMKTTDKDTQGFGDGRVLTQLNAGSAKDFVNWYMDYDEDGKGYPVLMRSAWFVHNKYDIDVNYTDEGCTTPQLLLDDGDFLKLPVALKVTEQSAFYRTLPTTAWETCLLPFDVTLTDEVLAQASFARITGIKQDEATVADLLLQPMAKGEVLEHGKPYLLRANAADTKLVLTPDDNIIYPTEAYTDTWQTLTHNYYLAGTFNTPDSHDGIWYAIDTEQGAFVPKDSDSPFVPNHLYFALTSRSDNPYGGFAAPERIRLVAGSTTVATIDDTAITLSGNKTDGFTAGDVSLADKQTYTSPVDFTASSLAYSRSFSTAGAWQMWYAPFDVTTATLEGEGMTAAYIEGIHRYDDNDDGRPDRTELEVIVLHDAVLQAGTPYMVKKSDTNELRLILADAVLHASEARSAMHTATTTADYDFYGAYAPASPDGKYVLGIGVNTGTVTLGRTTSDIPAQRWYLVITDKDVPFADDSNYADTYGIHVRVVGDNTNGIVTLRGDAPTEAVSLTGRKATTAERIVITGGKKHLQ